MRARLATPADAVAIARIYNEGIAARTATFETRLRSEADVREWFDGTHPIVVAEEDDGAVAAFASTSAYNEREFYAGVFEFSVYVGQERRRRGAGRVALGELLSRARSAGAWKLVSRVFVDNAAGRALVLSLGFREVGTYFRHGKLDGSWRDVVIVEKFLAPLGGEARPAPPSRSTREQLLVALREGSPESRRNAVELARALVVEQGARDEELLTAALDAFFASRAHDPASRGAFVGLFRAYASLSPTEANEAVSVMLERLGRLSIALDMTAFYEALHVLKQALGVPGGRPHAPELAPHLPLLVSWIRATTELPPESRGRISPGNVTSLLMSLALAACGTDAERQQIAELAADAKTRLRVETPSSIRSPPISSGRASVPPPTLVSATPVVPEPPPPPLLPPPPPPSLPKKAPRKKRKPKKA